MRLPSGLSRCPLYGRRRHVRRPYWPRYAARAEGLAKIWAGWLYRLLIATPRALKRQIRLFRIPARHYTGKCNQNVARYAIALQPLRKLLIICAMYPIFYASFAIWQILGNHLPGYFSP